MVIIFGRKLYGAVDEQSGEKAVTRFAHLYYMPLFPIGSMWVTGPDRGIPTALNLKSVAAGYARTWGLLVGSLMTIFGFETSIFVSVLGVILLAASAATWMLWSKRTSEDARLRGNLNALAFGTYCSPELFTPPIREHYKLELQRRVQIAENPRPPDDVARFGTRDLGELVRAYGTLTLHDSPQAREQLSQLLELEAPSTQLSDGVYREKHADDPTDSFQLPGDRPAMLAAIEGIARQRMLRA